MSDLPDPLVPVDTDLTVLAGFMLNVDHLLASELVAIGTPEECWAALMLWCRAWKQTPAGSLPNDDRVLAHFSAAGRRWPKVREVALHGFVLCADGRLYHRFLCQEVLRAHAQRTSHQRRRETDRKRLSEWRLKQDGNDGETRFDTRSETIPSPPPPSALPLPTSPLGQDGTVFPPLCPPLGGHLPPRFTEGEPHPMKEPKNGGKQPKTRTRIAPDWQPDLADCAYAASRGWDVPRIGEEADAFADRCRRDQPLYADWHAAWRMWVRNADKFAARPSGEAAGRHTATRSGSFATAARNVAARYDNGGK